MRHEGRAVPSHPGERRARPSRRAARRIRRKADRGRADGRRPVRRGREHVSRPPGQSAEPGLQLRAVGAPDRRRHADDGLRARRHRGRQAGEAGAPVLALLPVQRLQQQARVGLGDDPADVRRRLGGGRAERRRLPRSATPSTPARSGPHGTTRSSRSRACTRSSTPPPARTRTSSSKDAVARGASAQEGVRLRRHAGAVAGSYRCRPSSSPRRPLLRPRRSRGLHSTATGARGERPEQRADRTEHEGAVDGAGHLVGGHVA